MADIPINKRTHRTFLSHAHVDKAFVDNLHVWLTDFAGMKVWYDAVDFPSGLIASTLGSAIENCQSGILILSEKSIASRWVQEEWNIFYNQEKAAPDFQIVLLQLDDCVPPTPLNTRTAIRVPGGELTPKVACQIIEALHFHQTRPSEITHTTFYLARGSRPDEVESSKKFITRCQGAGCRFVRDAPDRFTFSESRIKSLIASTNGVLAFVPHRGNGATSDYILKEIRYAKEMNVPALVVMEEGVARTAVEEVLPTQNAVVELGALASGGIEEDMLEFMERTSPPLRGSHCFLGHAFSGEQRDIWQSVKRVVEVVSGLPCVSGDDLTGESAQNQIVEKISKSAVSIFDITEDRLNSCIEAGIARGAGVKYELVCRGPRRRPPFMFRDKQVFFYDTPTELLGQMRKLVFELRRVVI